jgi:hypothetical protein
MSEAQQEAVEEIIGGMMLDEPTDEGTQANAEQEADAPRTEAGESEPEGEQAEVAEQDDDGDGVSFDERQQAEIDRIMARRTARYKSQVEEAERARQELEQRLQALEQGGSAPQTDPETGAPVVPDFPDPFDAQYEEKIKARDEALSRRARWEAEQEVREQQAVEQHQRQLAELNKKTQDFVARGKDYGLTPDDIRQAGEFINQSGGLAPELVAEILEDEAGPAIPQYLYRNPQELQKVQGMTPFKAARYIDREIRPKALRTAKRKTPPPPVATETGAGSREERGLAGATYE